MNETMRHPTHGLLQAHLDREVTSEDAERLERHMEECADCARELALLRAGSAELSRALRMPDAPSAAVPAFRPPAATPGRAAGRGWSALPRAAVLVLGFAAAASAAIPGSPVRDWLGSLVDSDSVVVSAPSAEETPVAPVPEPEAGVSIAPESGAVRIALEAVEPGVVVTVTLVDGARAGVYATGEAASARFVTAAGRVAVRGARSGELRIEIPAGVPNAVVEVAGAVQVMKDGAVLRLVGGERQAMGERLSFTVR